MSCVRHATALLSGNTGFGSSRSASRGSLLRGARFPAHLDFKLASALRVASTFCTCTTRPPYYYLLRIAVNLCEAAEEAGGRVVSITSVSIFFESRRKPTPPTPCHYERMMSVPVLGSLTTTAYLSTGVGTQV